MTYREFKDIARRVRYKPDWTINVGDLGDEVWVWIGARVRDAYPPHGMVPVNLDYYYPLRPIRNEAGAIRRLKDAVDRTEQHEVGEWFRYRGRRVCDPHIQRRNRRLCRT